ncbi:dual specificity mitogen-activated protein kinase kinase 4-like [Oscarella lobularis]|uniref:dual specificity mitogen-activated protein kinase kinase 4-like n=1 Tax=Oscarella lobularis TaxID=121494 RepID=UPI00331375E8
MSRPGPRGLELGLNSTKASPRRRLMPLPNLSPLPQTPPHQQTPPQPQPARPRRPTPASRESVTFGVLTFKDKSYNCIPTELLDVGVVGEGAFGTVNKMVHKESNTHMAVKRVHVTVDESEMKRLNMDLDVIRKSNCAYIVKFYGVLFGEGYVWICMEMMDTSMDKLYQLVYKTLGQQIPERIIGKINASVVNALQYLKDTLKIIHRDVKPSNILLDLQGNVKLCDFGISGHLRDSIARTKDEGCRPYMSPERIQGVQTYDVRSDVWSLGLSLIELATGQFPYREWKTVFDQLSQVVHGDPPQLPTEDGRFSPFFEDFVASCLVKDPEKRPKYKELMMHPFYQKHANSDIDIGGWYQAILAQARSSKA